MSETPINKPLSSFPQSEKFNEAFGDVRDKAQEALKNPEDSVQKAQNLAKQYQPILLAAGATYLLFKIEKRMITKIVRKDNLIIKDHLIQLTKGLEDLAWGLGFETVESSPLTETLKKF